MLLLRIGSIFVLVYVSFIFLYVRGICNFCHLMLKYICHLCIYFLCFCIIIYFCYFHVYYQGSYLTKADKWVQIKAKQDGDKFAARLYFSGEAVKIVAAYC
uniref:Uncharacterized protein n=1 Tax=Zea mays TaxID=4577 RepID=A0A804PG43_MAIZE